MQHSKVHVCLSLGSQVYTPPPPPPLGPSPFPHQSWSIHGVAPSWQCIPFCRGMLCVTAESSKGLVQLRLRDLAEDEAQSTPWRLISDLQAAAKQVAANMWPLIRVSVNLDPESDGPEETRGTVMIKVVLCLHSTRQRTQMLQPGCHEVLHADLPVKRVRVGNISLCAAVFACQAVK